MARTLPRFGGVAAASLAAGPLFVLSAVISARLDNPSGATPVYTYLDGTNIGLMLVGIPVMLVVVVIVGGMISVLPNLIGTAAMTWLGQRNPGMQLPVFWVLAGAAVAVAPIAALIAASDMDWAEASSELLVPLVLTGGCCALICRRHAFLEPRLL